MHVVTVGRIDSGPEALRFLPDPILLFDLPNVTILCHARLLIVEVNETLGSDDRAVFLASRRVDMRKFWHIVPIFGWLPDSIDLLRHIEVASRQIAWLISGEINHVAVIRETRFELPMY